MLGSRESGKQRPSSCRPYSIRNRNLHPPLDFHFQYAIWLVRAEVVGAGTGVSWRPDTLDGDTLDGHGEGGVVSRMGSESIASSSTTSPQSLCQLCQLRCILTSPTPSGRRQVAGRLNDRLAPLLGFTSGGPNALVVQTHPPVERADEHGEFYLVDSASCFFRAIHRVAIIERGFGWGSIVRCHERQRALGTLPSSCLGRAHISSTDGSACGGDVAGRRRQCPCGRHELDAAGEVGAHAASGGVGVRTQEGQTLGWAKVVPELPQGGAPRKRMWGPCSWTTTWSLVSLRAA
ncbi:hypothetical protein FB45DRAFT_932580 [Roridomyces roridus]|uniref:Uncharacterized protein n=1 Tax=Roridomyces roridus TaxID=1738132 RepID=A0AAD7BD12_9AGAR|nr:hypothetical protein FB45DRAFT_932580 [Roridomyces roridus]